jgi:hypothetical protein
MIQNAVAIFQCQSPIPILVLKFAEKEILLLFSFSLPRVAVFTLFVVEKSLRIRLQMGDCQFIF